jgi:nucleoside phosphorylase
MDVVTSAVGIGLSAAAVGTARVIEVVRPRVVVLVGTCGAYPHVDAPALRADGGLAIGDVAVARRVRLVDGAWAHHWAAFPEAMNVLAETTPSLAQAFVTHGGRMCDVATTLGVTTDDATALRIARESGCATEHMEAHGVATACAAAGVAFGAVLGVANMVGGRAREEWRAHHRDASSRAIDVVTRWLQAGAVGTDVEAPLR